MSLPRRHFLRLAACAAALPVTMRQSLAQGYPSRPVRWTSPFVAGGPGDTLARKIAQWLSDRLGQPFYIENRPGGGANIGTEAVVRSPSDGYNLLLVTTANAVNATLYEKLSFNFLRDIAPVASFNRVPAVLEVNPALPVNSVPDLIAYAKANPGKLNMASAGNGSIQHITGELFKMMAGVNMVHVPYRGQAPALTDLIGGQVQVLFDSLPGSIEHIRAGKVRALAVTTSVRSEALPDVPTVGEFVNGFEASAWYGVGIPFNTPVEIIDKLNKEINTALADPVIKSWISDLGGVVFAGSPADFGIFLANETEKWGKVVRAANIKT
jgi:tripartite-type tricarboxylate transporter receptor subunit TctC